MSVYTWTLRLAPTGSGAQPFSLYVSQMTSVLVYAEWHRQIARRPGTMTTFAASGQTVHGCFGLWLGRTAALSATNSCVTRNAITPHSVH
jgi:hypothetical protein